MEKDSELKGEGLSYTTEYRAYDPRIGRWLSTDPKAFLFISQSPYHFGYNNPIITVDVDGAENIVVVGNQGKSPDSDKRGKINKKSKKTSDYTYGENTRHFLQAGLNRAREMKKNNTENGEQTTLLIYNGDYSSEEIAKYKEAAEKDGINVVVVTDAADVADYINKKATWTWFGNTKARDNDLVTDFSFMGHGNPTSMLVGYNSSFNGDPVNGSDINKNAFDANCNIELNSCGSGLGSIFSTMQSYTKGKVKGYNVTVEWGANESGKLGIGNYRAFHLEYTTLENRNKKRKEVPVGERTRVEKGTRKD
jgi:RHS repeat-associated protein